MVTCLIITGRISAELRLSTKFGQFCAKLDQNILTIKNPTFASNFIMASQEEKVTNEITGFSTIVCCDCTMSFLMSHDKIWRIGRIFYRMIISLFLLIFFLFSAAKKLLKTNYFSKKNCPNEKVSLMVVASNNRYKDC